jgi:hypothetical protein
MIPKVKKELMITESSIKFKKIFFLLILLSTVLYFLFLVIIDFFEIKNVKQTSFPLFVSLICASKTYSKSSEDKRTVSSF